MRCRPTPSCSTRTGASCSGSTSGCSACRSTGPKRSTTSTVSTRRGRGTWKRVMQSVELLQKEKVEFNVLCVLSQANVDKPQGALHVSTAAWASTTCSSSRWPSSTPHGQPAAVHHHARAVRALPVRDLRPLVAGAAQGAHPLLRQYRRSPGGPEARQLHDARDLRQLRGGGVQRRRLSVRLLRGERLETGQHQRSIPGPRSRAARGATASRRKKTIAHPECQVCEYQSICHGGCPKFRHGPHGKFDDLDYFCAAYKMIFAKAWIRCARN